MPRSRLYLDDGRVLVRQEQPGDVEIVRVIVAAAFARPDAPDQITVEVTLLDELRADEGWLPPLSLVAAEPASGEVVGHVVCTRGSVDGKSALGLGPLAVRPDRQRRGVGPALMHSVLGAADALGEALVALLGEPEFYGRYGFRGSSEYGVAPPDPRWGSYFQVRTLRISPTLGHVRLRGAVKPALNSGTLPAPAPRWPPGRETITPTAKAYGLRGRAWPTGRSRITSAASFKIRSHPGRKRGRKP